jgi:hypothetical protein
LAYHPKEITQIVGVSERDIPRRLFELMKGKVTGGWRKLHNEELRNLFSSNYPNFMQQFCRQIRSRRKRRNVQNNGVQGI